MSGDESGDAVLRWLLEGDPAIRWHVLRDLEGGAEHDIEAERQRVALTAGGRPASSIRPCEPQVEVADRRPEHAAGARWGRQSPEHGQNGWRGITKLPPDLVGDSGRIMRRAQPNGLRSIGNAARMGRHVGDGRSVTCRPSRGRQRSGRQSPEPPREPGPLGRGPFRSASRHSRRLGRRR